MTESFFDTAPETGSEPGSGVVGNPLPRGVSADQFRRVLGAVEIAFRTKSHAELLPAITEVARLSGVRVPTVVRVVNSPEGKSALLKRGIRWTTNINLAGVLTPEQVFTIGIITDPSNRRPFNEKLKQVGISAATYKNWMKQPVFAAKMNEIGESLLGEHIAAVHARLANRAEAGDVAAMKLFYEVSGRHDPSQKQMLDVVRIIQLVLEAITRHESNPAIIAAITQDIDVVLAGGTPKARGALPANYIESEVVHDERGTNFVDYSGSSSSGPSVPGIRSLEDNPVDGSVVVPFSLPGDFFEYTPNADEPNPP